MVGIGPEAWRRAQKIGYDVDWMPRSLGAGGGGVDFQAGNYWGTVDLEEGGDWTQMRTETMPLPSAADYIRSQ